MLNSGKIACVLLWRKRLQASVILLHSRFRNEHPILGTIRTSVGSIFFAIIFFDRPIRSGFGV